MSSEQQIPRLDPEGRMGLGFHMPRALMRKNKNGQPEFEHLDPEARRAAIKRAAFREGDSMRAKLLQALDRLENQHSPEQAEFLSRLEAQYADALSVWTTKYPLNVDRVPSAADLTQWLSTLSGETLDGLRELGATTLEIVPPEKVPALLKLLDQNRTIPRQQQSGNYWPDFWDNIGSNEWKFALTNTSEDLIFDPTIFYADSEQKVKRTNEEMVAEYKRRYQGKGITIMPPHGYVPTAARQMAQRKVIDRQTWSAFERPADADVLPDANFVDGRVDLGGGRPEVSNEALRCRPWVEGR